MTKIFFFILFISHSTFAEDLSGCLSPGGAGRLLIDKNCECAVTKTCATFKPRRMNKQLYEGIGPNNSKTFSLNEKNKLNESYDVFYKIMELKASGRGQSEEIKDLYIKLDKLNLDVRKSLMQNHSADYGNFKTAYRKDQVTRKKKNEIQWRKIQDLVKNGIKADSTTPMASAQVEAPSVEVKTTPVQNTFPTAFVAEATPKVEDNVKDDRKEENEIILKSLKPNNLQRNEDDSLFDIITKSYKRAAYPILLAP